MPKKIKKIKSIKSKDKPNKKRKIKVKKSCKKSSNVDKENLGNGITEKVEDKSIKHEQDVKIKQEDEKNAVKSTDEKKIRLPKSAYPVTCVRCGKILKNSVMRSKHEKKCGPKATLKGPDICHLCGASFKSTASLNHHLSINCENSCKICGQVFKSRYAQRDHLFFAHGQVVAKRETQITKQEIVDGFQCDRCDKIYTKKYTLLAHVKKAHENTDGTFFQCNECGKCMTSERSLTIHMSLHRPPEMECPMCGKMFHNKKYLDRHARQVHTQQQDMKFKCDICGRGFAVKRHLEEHKNVHLNLKPNKCRWCDRVYQNLANQNAHERTTHREAYLAAMSSGYKRIQVKRNPPIEAP